MSQELGLITHSFPEEFKRDNPLFNLYPKKQKKGGWMITGSMKNSPNSKWELLLGKNKIKRLDGCFTVQYQRSQ